ncbi:MAG: HigA family addiction module antitoxin [Vulcanimicrobiaceae bacterium]
MAKRPVHPGEVLSEDVLMPLGLSASKLARELRIPTNHISEIIAERRSVTADTALRLARFLGTSAEFWIGLQADFDLNTARRSAQKWIEQEVRPRAS